MHCTSKKLSAHTFMSSQSVTHLLFMALLMIQFIWEIVMYPLYLFNDFITRIWFWQWIVFRLGPITMRPPETCRLNQSVNMSTGSPGVPLPSSSVLPKAPYVWLASFLPEFVLSTVPPNTLHYFWLPFILVCIWKGCGWELGRLLNLNKNKKLLWGSSQIAINTFF